MIIEVAFRGNRKEFFTWDGPVPPPPKSYVIVDADRGEDLGQVFSIGEEALKRSASCSHGCGMDAPQHRAIRLATKGDIRQSRSLDRLNQDARKKATEKVHQANLVMKISDAEWQWDKKKLTLYFTADKRVDFRNLVRELAAMFRTRIELKQIGVRDEAKRLDGIGRCGRQYCSAAWLPELRPVNLGVAKDQRLSLNPAQISGACGRLMCCLRYEHEFYVESRKRFPKEGRVFMTARGQEKVTSIDLFRESVTLAPLSGDGGPNTIPLAEFDSTIASQPAQMDEVIDDSQSFEVSPDLMYTAEFAVPQPRLVILTENLDTEVTEPPKTIKRPRRRRGRGGRGGQRNPKSE